MKINLKQTAVFLAQNFNLLKNFIQNNLAIITRLLLLVFIAAAIIEGALLFAAKQELKEITANRQQIAKEHNIFLGSKQDLEQEVIFLMQENKKLKKAAVEDKLLLEKITEDVRKNYKEIQLLNNKITGLENEKQELTNENTRLQEELNNYSQPSKQKKD